MDRSQYRSIISRVWQAWHSSLWQQAELDYIGNIEALENERLVLNHELHSTKATDKAALEAAALQFEALLASQGEACSCRLRFIAGAFVHTHPRHTWMFVFWSLCVFESCVSVAANTRVCVLCDTSYRHEEECWTCTGGVGGRRCGKRLFVHS